MDTNTVSLTGRLVEAQALRHTPAGIPLMQFRLAHESHQIEAGFRRQIQCEVNCVVLGDTAAQLAKLKAGAQVRVTGFLNRKNRMSAQLVLHATETEILRETNHGNDE